MYIKSTDKTIIHWTVLCEHLMYMCLTSLIYISFDSRAIEDGEQRDCGTDFRIYKERS